MSENKTTDIETALLQGFANVKARDILISVLV